ncbi:hypothetical protein ACFPRL_07890 [Pseudoclavibacter helvolus]
MRCRRNPSRATRLGRRTRPFAPARRLSGARRGARRSRPRSLMRRA